MKRAPTKVDLSAEYVRELFDYDQQSGLLRHKARHGVKAGAIAGCIGIHGYVVVKIHQRPYLAHRVIWILMTGKWPEAEVDHRDTVKDNNQWDNLREANRSQNVANGRARTERGLKGAHKTPYGKWASQIRDGGRVRYLGTFRTAEEAHAAYVSAAKHVFGEFARAA